MGTCIIGGIIIIYGFLLKVSPPKFSNKILGYKSPMSMKNQNAWYEGNRFFGKLILGGGVIEVIISILILYFYRGETAIIARSLSLGYAFMVIVSAICTERYLFRLFEKK